MKNGKRVLAAAAALIFAAVVLCSSFAVAALAEHDCPGEGCRLCLVQTACENTLRLTGLFICLVCFGISVSLLLHKMRRSASGCFGAALPVKLKTKLLN